MPFIGIYKTVRKESMREPTFLIMTALAAGAQHGYGIMADVARISDSRVRLRAGTLYAALDRLKADGLVTSDRDEIVDGRLRRYYRITMTAGEAGAGRRGRHHPAVRWPGELSDAAAADRAAARAA